MNAKPKKVRALGQDLANIKLRFRPDLVKISPRISQDLARI